MRGIARTLILGLAVAATAAGTGGLDGDGDGVPDLDDCAPGDASIWAPPLEPVDDLMLSRSGTEASLAWSRPADVGGVPGSERYDTLASAEAWRFGHPSGFCPELNGAETAATDDRPFGLEALRHYLVRVENSCGVAPIDGLGEGGAPRTVSFREVTNLDDDGDGSLRTVVSSSNAGDAICLDVTGTLTLTSDPLEIDKNIAVAGPGADELTLAPGGPLGGFSFITLREQAVLSGLRVDGALLEWRGIYATDSPTIEWTTITNFHKAIVVDLFAAPTITTTTIAGNAIGIESNNYSSTSIRRSTLSGNTDYGIYAYVGSIAVYDSTISDSHMGVTGYGSEFAISSSTISGNTIGVYVYYESNVTLQNTILSNSTNCHIGDIGWSEVFSEGHNMASDGTCAFTEPGDQQSIDPLLDSLADNGGPTATHALLVGSPAIDVGSCSDRRSDQRGLLRPIDDPSVADVADGCDVGSYEKQ